MPNTNVAQNYDVYSQDMGSKNPMSITATKPQRENSRPVDLVHLGRQSLGDQSLEMEILGLFASQSELYMDRLANAKTAEERKMAAHTILGSARGIGAWDVAAEAEKIEMGGATLSDLTDLRCAVDAANDYIQSLL